MHGLSSFAQMKEHQRQIEFRTIPDMLFPRFLILVLSMPKITHNHLYSNGVLLTSLETGEYGWIEYDPKAVLTFKVYSNKKYKMMALLTFLIAGLLRSCYGGIERVSFYVPCVKCREHRFNLLDVRNAIVLGQPTLRCRCGYCAAIEDVVPDLVFRDLQIIDAKEIEKEDLIGIFFFL
jgi:hypothetical protein